MHNKYIKDPLYWNKCFDMLQQAATVATTYSPSLLVYIKRLLPAIVGVQSFQLEAICERARGNRARAYFK